MKIAQLKKIFIADKKIKMTALLIATIFVAPHAVADRNYNVTLGQFEAALAHTKAHRFDHLKQNIRMQTSKASASNPSIERRLFTEAEYNTAVENGTLYYEEAMRLGLFNIEVQRDLGIEHVKYIEENDAISLTARFGRSTYTFGFGGKWYNGNKNYPTYQNESLTSIRMHGQLKPSSEQRASMSAFQINTSGISVLLDMSLEHSRKIIDQHQSSHISLKMGNELGDSNVGQTTAMVSIDKIEDPLRIFRMSFAERYGKAEPRVQRALKGRSNANALLVDTARITDRVERR